LVLDEYAANDAAEFMSVYRPNFDTQLWTLQFPAISTVQDITS